MELKKLLLCSGGILSPYGQDGWFRVDGNPMYDPDLVATLPPIPDVLREMGPWDRIALIHGIEHFYRWNAVALVKQCREILVPGGQLILEQPNLATCIVRNDSEMELRGIYGETAFCDPAMIHRFGYTPESLTKMVRRTGFATTVIEEAHFYTKHLAFRLVATA